MEINKIYCENCLDTMSRMPNGFVDLTVTSPPYDNLRTYKKGFDFDWKATITELYRVIKPGGVVVWVVGDATIKGSETGTSFRQALYFKEVGFNLHDTMIWQKPGFSAVGALSVRYAPVFEYMFILSKGRIKTFNPLKDRKVKHPNSILTGTIRNPDGTMKRMSGEGKTYGKGGFGQRYNVWEINPQSQKQKHPAPFPEQLASDHIISWSNENDLIYDPFMGSGTTAKMAILNNRNYIGSEISKEYIKIAEKRINENI